jgi:hypothetical protein
MVKWFKSLFDQTDPTTDAKLLGYLVGIITSVLWLTYQLRKGMDANWLTCYGLFLGYTALGNITSTIETIKRKDQGNGV